MRNHTIDLEMTRQLRMQFGEIIRLRRQVLKLSQQQLADRVGVSSSTIVDQFERGVGRIEPNSYQHWADGLELPLTRFVAVVLRHFDPIAHALFVPYDLQILRISELALDDRTDLG